MRAQSSFSGQFHLYTSGVRAAASHARPLDVLKDIDESVSYLTWLSDLLSANLEYGDRLLKGIDKKAGLMDEDNLLPMLESDQDKLSQLNKILKSAERAMTSAPVYRRDAELNEAFERTIDALKLLFEQIETMRWAIMEHNVDAGPRGKPQIVSTPDELRKALAGL